MQITALLYATCQRGKKVWSLKQGHMQVVKAVLTLPVLCLQEQVR